MSFNIYSKIKTTLKREEILNELDKLLNISYSSSGTVPHDIAPVCKECGIDVLVSQDALQALRKQLVECEVVKITTATLPEEELLDVIYSGIFSLDSFGLLELSADEDIKGGLVVYRNGRVFDYSLSSLVGALFKSPTFQQTIASMV